tara:strand:- start:10167 stop:11717 length:1551 start_codon:yes stop_codon:yes gene_type:complete
MQPNESDIRKALKEHKNTIGASKFLREMGYKFSNCFIRKACKEIKSEKPLASGTIHNPIESRAKLKGKRFVFTCAQNNTHVHKDFLKSLETYCKANNAQLIVSKVTYNQNGFQNLTKEDKSIWYDPKIVKYLSGESMEVAKDLIWCGELNILPTAVDPVSGLENYTGIACSIIPHAKVRLLSVPTMKHEPAKFIYTTGSVTQRNYIQKKSGQKASFHHVFGAVVVEFAEDGNWHARHLIADKNGEFYDLKHVYTPKKIYKSKRVEAINWGDIHIGKEKQENIDNCHTMLEDLKPRHQFIHDVYDFTARNHHNLKNKFHMANEYFHGVNSVKQEIKHVSKFLNKISRSWCNTVIVESNHDLAFKRWLTEASVASDPVNAEFFHTACARVYKSIRKREKDFSIFEWAVKKSTYNLSKCTFLRQDESYRIKGIECGMHGHVGPNGSRGSPKGLSKIGVKCNTGHTHTAGIIDGIYTAGVTGNLEQGYNIGPSSWSITHIVTYPNGKRTLITMKEGKYHA